MLRIVSDSISRTCDGISRRSFLQVGALGLGGLGPPQLISSVARAGGNLTNQPSYFKDKCVIFLFLGGGPSQLETWDPKPNGVGTSTSLAGHIPTSIPGVRFASYFPKLGKLANRLTMHQFHHEIRSFCRHPHIMNRTNIGMIDF